MITENYRQSFFIRSFDANKNGKLKLSSLFHFLQEVAGADAARDGFGYEDMDQSDTLWVLSRLCIRVQRWPDWKEKVTVETWPKRLQGLFGMRDFFVMDAQGEKIAAAASAWLILNKRNHRPRDPQPFFEGRRLTDINAMPDLQPEKLQLPEEMKEIHKRRAWFSDLDISGHINNSKYADWIADALMEEGCSESIHEIEVNFLGETYLGDELNMFFAEENGAVYFSGRKGQDGHKAFDAVVRFGR